MTGHRSERPFRDGGVVSSRGDVRIAAKRRHTPAEEPATESAVVQQAAPGFPAQTRLVRLAILGVIGLVLSWEVLSRSVAAYLADVAPEAALWLDARQPTALVRIADRMLNAPDEADKPSAGARDQEASRNSQIRLWAESAIMKEPINAQAARILGQIADAKKDDAYASQLMEAAAHFSLHDTFSIYWMMKRRVETQNFADAIYYADILMRTRPELGIYIVPILAKIAEDGQANGLLKTILAGNPPWRGQFLATLPNSVTDARTPLEILLTLRTSLVPPTSGDVNPYLTFLVGHELFDLAYYTWLQFLPPEGLRTTGRLFNGSFETPSSGAPFDWTITQGSGVTIDVVPRPDESGEHALLVEFQYGRVDFHAVTQLVLLAPGTYKLEGKYKSDLMGPKGVKWHMTCANRAGAQIGEGPVIIGTTPAWKSFEFSFTVPDTNCSAQYVRLDLEARVASERLISGSVLFDELEISRLADPPT